MGRFELVALGFLVLFFGCETRFLKDLTPASDENIQLCQDQLGIPGENCTGWKNSCDDLFFKKMLEDEGVIPIEFLGDVQQDFLPWCENVNTFAECYEEIDCDWFYDLIQCDPETMSCYYLPPSLYTIEYAEYEPVETEEPLYEVHTNPDGSQWAVYKKLMARIQKEKKEKALQKAFQTMKKTLQNTDKVQMEKKPKKAMVEKTQRRAQMNHETKKRTLLKKLLHL